VDSIWQTTPDTSDYLEELIKGGRSAGEMADALTHRFGIIFTRSQVMGKLKRMRLSLRRAEIRDAKALEPPPPPPEPKRRAAPSHFNPMVKTYQQQPSFPPIPLPLTNHPGYRFAEVPRGGCMFEISKHDTPAKDFRFCGLARYAAEPYCEAHFEVTLAKPKK